TEARAKFDEIIAFAELEEFVEMKLKNYSSGMQVRLAFSVALQADADILLIDEVLAVGDAAFQQKCFDVFQDLRDRGRTVILVTHNMAMIERFCSRAMMLERGKMVAVGDPVQVAQAYTQVNFDRSSIVDPHSDRHGDGSATLLECWIENGEGKRVDLVAPGDWFTVKLRIRFNAPVDGPVLSVTIRDDANALAFNTNTSAGELVTGSFETSDEAVYELRLQNFLGEGLYHVSPSVVHSDGVTLAEARERMTSFMSSGIRRTTGYVDLPFEHRVVN
ncbi:MAG: ABC transporter ATP-binding protein, partial [Thermoleophilia bacterium]|nr:ABC transporter ATP-binding protein [Thermoleophilia bacterium]